MRPPQAQTGLDEVAVKLIVIEFNVIISWGASNQRISRKRIYRAARHSKTHPQLAFQRNRSLNRGLDQQGWFLWRLDYRGHNQKHHRMDRQVSRCGSTWLGNHRHVRLEH